MYKGNYNKRVPDQTPESLINNDGTPNYGTFKNPLKKFNFPQFKRPGFNKFVKKHRLTSWEVVEASFDEFLFLGVVYKMGIMNFNMFVLYDQAKNEVYHNSKESLFGGVTIANNLLNGSVTRKESKKTKVEFINHFEDGRCDCSGYSISKRKQLSFDLKLKNLSESSIVSIPLTSINPLYTEKDFMSLEGSFKVDGIEKVEQGVKNYAIIDDHRGFYPRKSGYDWLTLMTSLHVDGTEVDFALNLTYFYKNIDQVKYNENGYWLNDTYYSLPVVTFKRAGDVWTIQDEEGYVNLEMKVKNKYHLYKNFLVVKIDYLLAFGEISGVIIDSNGNEIQIKNVYGIGEERYTKL